MHTHACATGAILHLTIQSLLIVGDFHRGVCLRCNVKGGVTCLTGRRPTLWDFLHFMYYRAQKD